jgi:arginyl-tRNA synthetase
MVDLGKEMAAAHGLKFLDMLSDEGAVAMGAIGIERMIQDIKNDLADLNVEFDVWFSETSLYTDKYYDTTMKMLADSGHITQREGATWFVSTELGEDKDNVLIKSTGVPTYFASDAAYHYNKFTVRGFDRVTNIWGADHMGHIGRVKAVVGALGIDPDRLNIIIGQMVALRRGGEHVKVSKRTGDMITLKELLEEVGADACRYFFLARSADTQMDFDMDLATKESQDNPVYYLQYAHARLAGILRNAKENDKDFAQGDVHLLSTPEELTLIRQLLLLPEIIDSIANTMEPHHLPHYTLELATAFHSFYDRCRVITDDEALTSARLKLVEASRIGFSRCLSLMGMNAPEKM